MSGHAVYRRLANETRFFLFELNHKESNLLVGVDRPHWTPAIAFECGRYLEGQRKLLEIYLAGSPYIATAWEPVPVRADAPELLQRMVRVAGLAGVGPMAAVAGTFAASIRDFIRSRFDVREIFVENGGDCALSIRDDLVLAIFGGESASTARHGLCLSAGDWGIGSSSGRIGHSVSFGLADVCTVICADPALADAYATAFANRLGSADDIEAVIAAAQAKPGVTGIYALVDGRIGCYGPFRLCPLALATH